MRESATFYETFYRAITERLALSYPATEAEFPFRDRIIPTLISPYVLNLPNELRQQAQNIVESFFRLRELPEWQAQSAAQEPKLTDPGNTSVLMSYDFHVDANGNLRLIEINTNASLSLIVDELHYFQKIENVFSADFKTEILDSFRQESNDSQNLSEKSAESLNIGIVDNKPLKQRLFIEFAMYRELFAKRGWRTQFIDPTELDFSDSRLRKTGSPEIALDLIYNRDTDFYFSAAGTETLRSAMLSKAVTITPHPHEYRLLADKDRLLELSNESLLANLPLSATNREIIQRALIKTVEVNTFDPDELWKDRKKWFFKPRRSHGGKAVYRGSSTSRSTFQSILAGDYLAQEIVPPPTVLFDGEDEELKYDLRFYVYRNKIQLSCARLYRGQMTNSQSLGGGVAPISWMR